MTLATLAVQLEEYMRNVTPDDDQLMNNFFSILKEIFKFVEEVSNTRDKTFSLSAAMMIDLF